MDFSQRLADTAKLVDARLAEILSAGDADGVPPRLAAAMRHAALSGGKRFRPLLVLESAALFGLEPAAALNAAAAIECLHCYSLVHDDLPSMDNDDVRRGLPTVHKAFDEWTAILAGDALLTLAFEILSSPSAHGDPGVRAELVLMLARAAGGAGMVGGQALDLESEKLHTPSTLSLAHVRRLQAMKTGALITFACEAGAILAAAGSRERYALRRFGTDLGLAFQIADDLLDAEGDAGTIGKATGKDAVAGKATLVALMGLQSARAALAEVEADAIAALEPFGSRGGVLREAARFVVRREK